MAAARPQTIASDLLKQLERWFDAGVEIDDFERVRFKRNAEALMRVNAAEAHSALGGLAALCWDIAGARDHVRACTRIDPSAVNFGNAAISLRQVALMREASEYAANAATIAPIDVDLQDKAVSLLVAAGKINQALAVFDQAKARGLKVDADGLNMSELRTMLPSVGVDQEELERELECAYQVLRNNRLRPASWEIKECSDPDGGSTVVFTVSVSDDDLDEIALDAELAVLLADEPGWDPTRLSVEFERMRVHADENA